MLRKLQTFFTRELAPTEGPDNEHHLQLASAALLIELSKADFRQDEVELEAIKRLLAAEPDISAHEIEELMELAEAQFEEDNAYHPFTRLINEHFSPEQKSRLIEKLWQVAFADGEISKYEDHLIRKIADLLYVPHREFIRTKLNVTEG